MKNLERCTVIPNEDVRNACRDLRHAIAAFEKAQAENTNRLMIQVLGKRCDHCVAVLNTLERKGA